VGSTKCPDCGLVNFSDAVVCKRCQAPLNDAPMDASSPMIESAAPLVEPEPLLESLPPLVEPAWLVEAAPPAEPVPPPSEPASSAESAPAFEPLPLVEGDSPFAEPLPPRKPAPFVEASPPRQGPPLSLGEPPALYIEPVLPHQPTRTSYRWAINATVVSFVLFFVTTFVVYMWTLIRTAVAEASKGWSDFSPEQLQQVGRRVGVLYMVELAIVWFLFYRRRDDR
jgi:hypothetical protein